MLSRRGPHTSVGTRTTLRTRQTRKVWWVLACCGVLMARHAVMLWYVSWQHARWDDSNINQPERLATFNDMATNDTTPSIMFGFYEPDCTCDMSSDMSTSDAATQWDALIAPLASKGTVLGSPSMCKQKDEDFLTPFKSGISTDWDVTSVHINKPDIEGVKEVVEYYVEKYGKPVWVSEFACVNDQPSWSPCTVSRAGVDSIYALLTFFSGPNSNQPIHQRLRQLLRRRGQCCCLRTQQRCRSW